MCSRRPLRQVRRLFSRLLISVLCFQCRIYDFLPLLVKIFLAHGTGLQCDAGEDQRDDDDGRGNDRILYGEILESVIATTVAQNPPRMLQALNSHTGILMERLANCSGYLFGIVMQATFR